MVGYLRIGTFDVWWLAGVILPTVCKADHRQGYNRIMSLHGEQVYTVFASIQTQLVEIEGVTQYHHCQVPAFHFIPYEIPKIGKLLEDRQVQPICLQFKLV